MRNELIIWVLGACAAGVSGLIGFFAKTAVNLLKETLAELIKIGKMTSAHEAHIDVHKTHIERLGNNVEKLDARVSALENK
jgi:hypothetical protein